MKCCDIFSFLCLVALLSGCATADVMLMDTSKIYPPTENVHIIFEEPTRAYIIIAIIEGDGTQYNNQSQIVRAMQKKAAKIGADAIFFTSTEGQYVPTTTHANPVPGGQPITIAGGTKYKMKALAIKFNA